MDSATTTSNARSPNRMGRLVAGIVFLTSIWIGLSFLGLFFPSYHGTEFSPYTFRSRDFRTGLLLGKTVVQPAFLSCPQEISQHLTNSALSDGLERWDLVECARGMRGSEVFEASILVKTFNFIGPDHGMFWEKWSKDHPKLAKILWPAIQQLAIHHSYFAMPELFRFAATNPSEAELRKSIGTISVQAGLDQGRRHLAKKEYNDARLTVEWAKTFGNSAEIDALEKLVRAGFTTLPTTRADRIENSK